MSSNLRAVFRITRGPHVGDSVSVEMGWCRLIGRHLSESETALIDRDGNRILDTAATDILAEQLKPAAQPTPTNGAAGHKHAAHQAGTLASPTTGSADAFERGSDIVFTDDAVSRAHAMIFYDSRGAGIIDLASTNGTFVNNKRTTSTLLHDGDVISLGSSELTVYLSSN